MATSGICWLRRPSLLDRFKQGRRWPAQTCYIRPAYCSLEELEQSVQILYRQFYSLPSIFSRLPLPISTGGVASWMLNFSQRHMVRNTSENVNFSDY